MDKYKYMQVYTLAFMDLVRWCGEDVTYDNDTGELRVTSESRGLIYYGKVHEVDYDSCAALLKTYLLEKLGVEPI